MIIGTINATLHLQAVASLKDKRRIVKSLIGRLQSRFNISVAEVDRQDSKLMAVIGIAVVATDTKFANQQLDAVVTFMQNDHRFYLGQVERETF